MPNSEVIKFSGKLSRVTKGFGLWFGFTVGFGIWPCAPAAGLPAGFPLAPFGAPGGAPAKKDKFGFGAAMHNCTWNEEKRIYFSELKQRILNLIETSEYT